MEFNKKALASLYSNYEGGAEATADYKHGGNYAVELGDTLNDKYEIIRKLGHGPTSNVWLGTYYPNQFVAIKVITGKLSKKAEKNTLLDDIYKDNAHSSHLVKRLDKFTVTGTNGTHVCEVLEPMGPSVADMWQRFDSDKKSRKLADAKIGLAQQFLRQVLMGLQELHTKGIAHGNVDASNWVLAIEDLSERVKPNDVKQDPEDPDNLVDVKKRQKGAPKKITRDEPLHKYITMENGKMHLKLTDFNACFRAGAPEDAVGGSAPAHMRAPEQIMSDVYEMTEAVDIWTLGCVLFELLTGHQLFKFSRSKSKEVDDEHLIEMNAVVGTLPQEITSKWKPTTFYAQVVGEHGHITPPPDFKPTPILEAHFDSLKPAAMDDDEAAQVKKLLRSMFQYDPKNRPSVAELLHDPWISASA
uniref:non-specific serine/threonine protein kinase n=1 Tax=Blastobotrys adeninivorans TaxID=409370 RepID=A0A060TED6_BLAAD